MDFFAGNRAALLLQTGATAAAVPLIASFAVAAVFFSPLWVGVATVGSLWAATVFWHSPRFVRSVRGTFDAGNVRVEYGVWLRRELFVPLSSLRTFEIWAPPLHRLFRCRTVILRFAGGAAVLPLLSCDTAAALTAELERNEE